MDFIRKPLRWLALPLGLAAAYALLGLLALRLTIPPDYVAPIYPAAGLALAALLSLGQGRAPAIWLGAFIVNVLLSQERGLPPLLAPALIALGSTAQAMVGCWAVRRWVAQPLLLSEPRDLAKFFLYGGGLACLVSPTVAVLALRGVGSIGSSEMPLTWAAWWIGDTMGVLVGAPIVLTLVGQPRQVWAPRRLSVGLPMLLMTALMALGTMAVTEWDLQRARGNFERDAISAANRLEARLREPLLGLEALRSLLLVNPRLSRADFQRGTAHYLPEGGPLLAMGMARRVGRDALAAFEREARAEGFTEFRARDRGRDGDLQTPANEDLFAIRLIEPQPRNSGALGINILSVPVAREAMQRARRSGRAVASAGFQLSQDPEHQATGVVVYQALYAELPQTEARTEIQTEALREAASQGAAFVTLRPDQLLDSVGQATPPYLRLCLIDTEPLAARRRLAGPEGCEARASGDTQRGFPLDFGGRTWEIHVDAPQGLPVDGGRGWPFALIALLSTGLLGSLLLLVTGRARRIEELVLARTAQLKHEIAERGQREAALRDSEQRFRNIFDTVPVGVVFADLRGVMEETNPNFCRLVGRTADELRGMRTIDVTHEDDREEDLRLGRMLLRGEIAMYRRHKRYLRADGATMQVRVVVSVLNDGAGRPYRMVGVIEDIADQLKMQTLERARQSAEAANQAKNDFLSRMSHELRTPLNAMLGFTQLLEMDPLEPLSARQRSRTVQISQAGWHLLEMINDTLDLSRIESGALRLDSARQDLPQLLDEALALVEGDAQARGLQVERRLDPAAGHVQGDATRIKQVLTNLLSNAVKYNHEGGRIVIASRRVEAQAIELEVSDTGLGMSQAQLAALFQPFNRLGRERSETVGTGIGLVIARRLAELMGGTLTARSQEGLGSSFTMRLPAADGDGTVPQAAGSAAAPRYAGRRRIVYIEDSAVNAEVMRGVLEQRPQIELEVCTSGQAGLDAIAASPPDLLLLDMQLPDMDGLAVLERLRATEAGHVLTVVVVSANAMPEQVRACEAAGIAQYLTKPIDVPGLLRLLDQLLADASRLEPPIPAP